MNINYWCFLTILWVTLLYSCGLLLFGRGFLLYRVVVNKNSSCHTLKENALLSLYGRDETWDNSQPGCWFPPKFKRVIILLVDGLRYDFASFHEHVESPNYFKNHMPIFHQTLTKSPSNSMLYKFVADPPTTTLQRLKALTTGSLPTYIDLSWNFASYAIDEDNLIRQLHRAGKRIVFMGDDTWKGLYPNESFHRSHFYPSFNVKVSCMASFHKNIINIVFKISRISTQLTMVWFLICLMRLRNLTGKS